MRRCTVTLPGARRVHYRRHGCGCRPPLVLLRESPETSLQYVPLMEELGDCFTTIALDTPGRGHSEPLGLEQPEIADYAAATVEALVALGLGPVPASGTHTGAMIALELACSAPELVAVAVALAARYAPPLGVEADGSPGLTPAEQRARAVELLGA